MGVGHDLHSLGTLPTLWDLLARAPSGLGNPQLARILAALGAALQPLLSLLVDAALEGGGPDGDIRLH